MEVEVIEEFDTITVKEGRVSPRKTANGTNFNSIDDLPELEDIEEYHTTKKPLQLATYLQTHCFYVIALTNIPIRFFQIVHNQLITIIYMMK